MEIEITASQNRSINSLHCEENAWNVHLKRFLRAQNYAHINQSKDL